MLFIWNYPFSLVKRKKVEHEADQIAIDLVNKPLALARALFKLFINENPISDNVSESEAITTYNNKFIIKRIKLSLNDKAKLITGTPLILGDEIIRESVAINKFLSKIFDIVKEELYGN